MTIVGTLSIRAWSVTEPDISNPSRIRTNRMPSIRSRFNHNIIVNITVMVILLSVILTMIITPDLNGLGENDRFRAEVSDAYASRTQDRHTPFRCCVLRKDVVVCSTIRMRMIQGSAAGVTPDPRAGCRRTSPWTGRAPGPQRTSPPWPSCCGSTQPIRCRWGCRCT